MAAYYNEIDPYAAAWLRELIKAGHIAPGEVDERSIIDVRPTDLAGYTQCHFFAGIGVWSYALRRAGWPDDRPIWTGSCPCQPFSAAGKGGGFDDERHLWPAWFHLIGECRPGVVLGEQVASKDGLGWLDLVQADLEAAGYASGAVDLCAAGVGAPHIRQRLWFVAERVENASIERLQGVGQHRHDDASASRLVSSGRSEFGRVADDDRLFGAQGRPFGAWRDNRSDAIEGAGLSGSGVVGGVGNAERISAGRDTGASVETQGRAGLWPECNDAGSSGPVCGLADASGRSVSQPVRRPDWRDGHATTYAEAGLPGPVNGIWRDADWLYCRDGKWRPVEPGTFPLAHGAPARVGRLRGYGNAINAEAAVAFIEAYLDIDTIDLDARRVRLMSRMDDDMGVFA